MRNHLKMIAISLLMVITILSCFELKSEKYKVELSFCDNRPKKTIMIESFSKPSNSDIDTYKQAVPKYHGNLNVCELKVIE